MEQFKIVNNTAEHLANQFIDMMNQDHILSTFPLYELIKKRMIGLK
jgi:hypothetical protein